MSAAACGAPSQPRVAGHYLVYGRNLGAETAVVVAHADGTGAHTVARGEDEALSPDGRWVAYDVARGAAERLFILSTRGGRPRFLTQTDSWPVWSPLADRIATIKGDALVSIDLHGHVTVLDRRPGTSDVGFSPDGRWVVYTWGSEATDETELLVVRASGGDRRVVTRNADNSPVWGEHWIAFERGGSIWRVRPDGSGRTLVLPAPRHPGRNGIWGYSPVAWAPNDRSLLGEIAIPDAWDVGIRIDAATGRFRRVHGYPVTLSHDGRFALTFGGRPPGRLLSGHPRPEWIAALPFDGGGRARVLARGDVCCPSWNR